MLEPADSLTGLVDQIDLETYYRLKSAVELGKWNNGERLSRKQLEYCLQAIIAWESRHLPEDQRTGFVCKA
ncbi:MAG: DUF1315 family protein [Pseudohongiellaceae bacterium]